MDIHSINYYYQYCTGLFCYNCPITKNLEQQLKSNMAVKQTQILIPQLYNNINY